MRSLFKSLVAQADIPTEEAQLKSRFKQLAIEQGSQLSNDSRYSPFWRIITALVTRPVLWLIELLIDQVLPNAFLKYAKGRYVDILAWAVHLERKPATTAEGVITFQRAAAELAITIPENTAIQSVAINGQVYEVRTTAEAVFKAGELITTTPVKASQPGKAYNLAPGYYAILPEPINGITQVTNAEDWLTSPGADEESDEALRWRARNQFGAVNQWHTDSVYRSLIAQFAGIDSRHIYFEHHAPRGPGTANAYILFAADAPAVEYLEKINHFIQAEGNHGHGDDLQVFALPEKAFDIEVEVWPNAFLSADQKQQLAQNITHFIRTAFRENSTDNYQPTQVNPRSRFSFSKLTEELHRQFPGIDSLQFNNTDIVSELWLPTIQSLSVVCHD
ncbi:baseplate J/gp47 family protein [Zooshikella marina]|uniref:baseplate J/gp47 family protein n=1 Tax=Zooshikella ganghwensis TaxID=202772 RepID=UPI001BAFCFDD|nr:baseplate J/gp47 family protein [Zooshikella ganghwensis]MBU2707715.1 baseplate J/gp47 family protein [Zooshikella ganghwensis]